MKGTKTVVASQGRTLGISPNQLRQGVNIEYDYNPYGLDPYANPGQLSLSDVLQQPPAPVLQGGNIDPVEVMGDAAEVAAGIAASGDCCVIS